MIKLWQLAPRQMVWHLPLYSMYYHLDRYIRPTINGTMAVLQNSGDVEDYTLYEKEVDAEAEVLTRVRTRLKFLEENPVTPMTDQEIFDKYK